MAKEKASTTTFPLTATLEVLSPLKMLVSQPEWAKDIKTFATACALLEGPLKDVKDMSELTDAIKDVEVTVDLDDDMREAIRKCLTHMVSQGRLGPHPKMLMLFKELNVKE